MRILKRTKKISKDIEKEKDKRDRQKSARELLLNPLNINQWNNVQMLYERNNMAKGE